MEPLTALALRPARGRTRTAVLLGFEPPRTTFLAFVAPAPPSATAGAIRRLIAPDALVVVPGDARPAEFREALRPARVLAFDPVAVLRFLWFFRDEHDLLSLGHASDRRLLDGRYGTRAYPDLATDPGRRAVNDLLRETALMIGVKLPRPGPAHRGPGPARAFLEAGLGLVAALLLLFAAPIAQVTPDGATLRLSDLWLREHGTPP